MLGSQFSQMSELQVQADHVWVEKRKEGKKKEKRKEKRKEREGTYMYIHLISGYLISEERKHIRKLRTQVNPGMKHHDQKQLEEERFYFIHSSISHFLFKTSKYRNSIRSGIWKHELMQRSHRVFLLALSPLLDHCAFL